LKTRPAAPRGTALSPTDKLPTRNPDAVGQIAAMGDATAAPRRSQELEPQPRFRAVVRQYEFAPTYTGEDRRGKDRRASALPTTLDTRKTGLDRRLAGRISLKV
jgi:hypothetical protein